MKTGKLFFLLLLSFLCAGRVVYGATHTIVAHMAFAEALTISNVSALNFGTVLAGDAGTFTLSTNGKLSASDSGAVLGGSVSPGSMTISGSSEQSINISADSYVADHGVTPSAATCAYDNGAAASCNLVGLAAPGSGKILLVGVTVTVDGTQAVGTTASPSFNILVNYQ